MDFSRLLNAAVLLLAPRATTAVPSVPPPISANAVSLQLQLNDAAKISIPSTLTIVPGVYVFSNTSATVTGATDLNIDAHGVTFVFYYGFGLDITNCHNVSVRGLTLDSDPPNYAQGVLTKLESVTSANGSTTSVATAIFDDAFLTPNTSFLCTKSGQRGSKIMFWDPATRLPLKATLNFMDGQPEQGGSAWRIHLQLPVTAAAKQAPLGSLVTLFGRRGITFQTTNSSQVLAEDVTIHAGGNMGFHENYGGGGHIYRRVRIVRKPGSTGLMALNADGFHSYSLSQGPTLEDSEISFTGDDFLNLWSGAYAVCAPGGGGPPDSNSLIIADSHSADASFGRTSLLSTLRRNDVLQFYKLLSGRNGGHTESAPLLGSMSVTVAKEVTDKGLLRQCRQLDKAMALPPYNASFVNPGMFAGAAVYNVTFSASLHSAFTAAADYNLALVSFPRMSSSGAVVRRNHFHDAAGSGGRLLLQTPRLALADNVFERFGGLYIWAGEQIYMGGTLGLHNISLRNTTFVDGGMMVCAGLRNVTCKDTTFVNSQGHATHTADGCSSAITAHNFFPLT